MYRQSDRSVLFCWLLGKSVLETHGIFWAWSIHFIRDVVIFAGMFAVSAAKERG